jgi:hypothetical protein
VGFTERAALVTSAHAATTAVIAQPPLPVPLTHFIGRQQELAEIRRLVRGTRLLTLTGTGGVGKTRLMIEVGP